MTHHKPGRTPLTFTYSNPNITKATHGTTTYILTSSTVDPLLIPELEGLLPSSSYTLQFLTRNNLEPLLLVGEQNPDKSLKKHHVWDFLGGKTHPGENPRDAALRERIEEVGITEEFSPYLDPVIYVVFNEDNTRCVKAFYFAALDYELINNRDFLKKCKQEIMKAADGRFELINIGTIKIDDFFEQILNKTNSNEAHTATLRALRLPLTSDLDIELHKHNTWRKHVPELLGNTVIQDLILKVVNNFIAQANVYASPTLTI